MLQRLYDNIPIISAVVVIAALVLVVGVGMGSGGAGMAAALLGIISAGLGWLSWSQARRVKSRDDHARQMRFIAERWQAMLETIPCGYCAFTPQGNLREERGASIRLGASKISHFDDILSKLEDGAELAEAFRRLQRDGEAFSLRVKVAKTETEMQIFGRRFRVGKDGPYSDVLWMQDVPARAVAKKSAADPLAQASAFDFAPFPAWLRGENLAILSCNSAYAAALDMSQDDVLREQRELMSQTAKGGSGRALAANAISQKTAQTERRHVIVAGKRRLLEITEAPLPVSGEPQAARLIGLAFDVTGEEEKESELKRHLAAHHEVMEHLGSAIAIYGADMRLEFYNRSYQRLWDATEAFLDSKPSFGEVLEDLRNRRRLPEQADFQRYKKERLSLFTSLIEPRDDMMHLPDGTSLRILSAPHPFGGIMFVHEDVTDRLALESSYNTLIAVQRETLDNLAEGIAVFGPDGKLRLSNPAFERIWKLAAEFVASSPHVSDMLERMKPLFKFGGEWADFKREMVGYALDRNPRAGKMERADNSVIEYLSVPLPDGAVLNSYLDVTDSVKVELALRASNAALATADRLKSEFVANVSYQLRTPLNTITGFADILEGQYFGTLNPKQIEYTRHIKDASENLSRLINDVLDLATIEAGRMTLERETVAVAEVLNLAKQDLAEWARQQSLDIIIDCPSDIGKFEVDEHRLRQTLHNLIGNSIKYTPAGGRITVSAAPDDGDWVKITVADTGIGIPEADLDRVFGKFERSNLHARQNGAGLGLSLAKSFIELHGGRIKIESEVGKGTRVHCLLPRKAT